MNKKRVLLPICFVVLVVIIGLLIFIPNIGRKPFSKISGADISSASIQLLPPNETVQVVELYELADTLNDIVIYKKDNSYIDYNGRAVIFTITMNDGTQTVINVYNPFIVIDDVGYRTKDEPCKRLSQLANNLVDK